MYFMSEAKPLGNTAQRIVQETLIKPEKEIAQLQAMKYPTYFYIPPIPAVALQKCEGEISNFWFEVEKIRKNFSSCRKKYAEYQKVIANPDDKPLGELIQKRREAVSEVEGELARLFAKRTDSRILMEMWDSTAEVILVEMQGMSNFNRDIRGELNR